MGDALGALESMVTVIRPQMMNCLGLFLMKK